MSSLNQDAASGEDQEGNYILAPTQYVGGVSGKSSQQAEEDLADESVVQGQQGDDGEGSEGAATPALMMGPASAGSPSAEGPAGNAASATDNGVAAALRNKAWTPGFERAMQAAQDREAPGRAAMARASRRSASATVPRASAAEEAAGEGDTPGDGAAAAAAAAQLEPSSALCEAIENGVEQQVADALGPLRIIVNDLNAIVRHTRHEVGDMNDQNDTLSRQIDMHYRDMQRHAETSRAHTGALTSIVGAHASVGQAAHENLAVAGTLVGHLSQVIINLPQSVNQVVNNAVAQAVQGALAQVMAAQNQSWEQVQAMVHYHYANIEYHRAAAVQQMLHQQQQQGHVHPPAGPQHAGQPPQGQHAGQPPQWQHEGQPQGRHGDAENGRQNVPGTNTLRGKFKAVLAKLRRLGRN